MDAGADLAAEGLARELVSKIQQMRKAKDFQMMDRINIYVDADGDVGIGLLRNRGGDTED